MRGRGRERERARERERECMCTSIVSVVNPRNDLGETSSKEKRERERENWREESGLD